MKSIILGIAVVLVGSLSGAAVVNATADYNSSRSNTSTSIHENVSDDVELIVFDTGKNGKHKKSAALQIHADVSEIVDAFPFPIKGSLEPPCEGATGC